MYRFFRFIFKAFGLLPLWFHRGAAAVLAFLVEHVARYRLGVVRGNLKNSFPSFSDRQLGIICHRFYRHLATVFTEAIWFGASSRERFLRSGILRIVNPEELERVATTAQSIVILCGHTGNWELSSGLVPASGGIINASNAVYTYRKLSSAFWDRFFLSNRLDILHGEDTSDCLVESRSLLRYVISHRSSRKIYFLNSDQRPFIGTHAPMEVEFLGRTVHTMDSGATLACKYGFAVLYQSFRMREGGGYDVEYRTICDDASGMDAGEIMRQYYLLLEEDIRQQPENYLWSHRRWSK